MGLWCLWGGGGGGGGVEGNLKFNWGGGGRGGRRQLESQFNLLLFFILWWCISVNLNF